MMKGAILGGAVFVAMVLVAWSFRYQPIGPASNGAYVYDRFTGKVVWLVGEKALAVSNGRQVVKADVGRLAPDVFDKLQPQSR